MLIIDVKAKMLLQSNRLVAVNCRRLTIPAFSQMSRMALWTWSGDPWMRNILSSWLRLWSRFSSTWAPDCLHISRMVSPPVTADTDVEPHNWSDNYDNKQQCYQTLKTLINYTILRLSTPYWNQVHYTVIKYTILLLSILYHGQVCHAPTKYSILWSDTSYSY